MEIGSNIFTFLQIYFLQKEKKNIFVKLTYLTTFGISDPKLWNKKVFILIFPNFL